MTSVTAEQQSSVVWWVNQGRSYEEEHKAGIVFASSGGRQAAHHLDVQRMRPGDVVLHYWASSISALGQVTAAGRHAIRPYEHNGQRDPGWQAQVQYFPLHPPIGFAELPEQPRSSGPFDRDGKIKQGYLYEVDPNYAATLRERFANRWPISSPWSWPHTEDDDGLRRAGLADTEHATGTGGRVGPLVAARDLTPASGPIATPVPIEEQYTERAWRVSHRESAELERREATLVLSYHEYLQAQGHVVHRHCIVPSGESQALYSDLWDATTRELVEAKGGIARDQLRQAVGQLLDYGRFVDAASRAVLVPDRPSADLIAYLASAQMAVIYPDGNQWLREGPSQRVP
jgi:hypothetical protein